MPCLRAASGREGGFMELGLLSNALLKPHVFWTSVAPPFFSALTEKSGARIICPPPLASERRKEWAAVWSMVRACDTLFWMQGASRSDLPIHVASLLKLRSRRSVFVIDAWDHLLTKIGIAATAQRLDPCFIGY